MLKNPSIRASSFVILSDFGFRHSDFSKPHDHLNGFITIPLANFGKK